MSKEARYDWRHGITKAKIIRINDKPCTTTSMNENGEQETHPNKENIIFRNENYRRLSLTIRKLLDSRRQAHVDEGWSEYMNRWTNEICSCDQKDNSNNIDS